MKPLGRMPWAGILLAGASLVLTVLPIALMDAQTPTILPIPKWLFLVGITGLLGGGIWVQWTWKAQ
ncbi:MAG: hypothetical protein JSS43_15900 [Proteobacteria bacterium]|nr:hypothetical protein [Pseudomonadota bacterium]